MMISSPEPAAARPMEKAGGRKPKSAMRALGMYFLFVFAGGALIAPRLYASAQFLEDISRRFSFIADQPFHRFVNRCIILLAIVGLPYLFKSLGIRSLAELGFRRGGRHMMEALHGFGWGFVALGITTALWVGCDARVVDWNHDSSRWLGHIRNAGLAAIFVALIEEVLFRGAFFTALRRKNRFWPAAMMSAFVYALLHFLEKPENPRFVEWDSGLIILTQMLSGLLNFERLLPELFNLLVLGVLFAITLERTGALHFSIGLHAGLIFWVKSFAFLTNGVAGSAVAFWGTDKLTDGWGTAMVLLLVFLLIERTLPPRNLTET